MAIPFDRPANNLPQGAFSPDSPKIAAKVLESTLPAFCGNARTAVEFPPGTEEPIAAMPLLSAKREAVDYGPQHDSTATQDAGAQTEKSNIRLETRRTQALVAMRDAAKRRARSRR
jgi:hypothetical protein